MHWVEFPFLSNGYGNFCFLAFSCVRWQNRPFSRVLTNTRYNTQKHNIRSLSHSLFLFWGEGACSSLTGVLHLNLNYNLMWDNFFFFFKWSSRRGRKIAGLLSFHLVAFFGLESFFKKKICFFNFWSKIC